MRRTAEDSEAAAQEAQLAAEQATADLALDVRRSQILDLIEEDAPIVPMLLAVELHERSRTAETLDTVARTLLGQPGWLGTVPGQYATSASHGPWLVTVERTQIVVRNPDDLSAIRAIAIDPFPEVQHQHQRYFAAVVAPDGRRMVVEQPDGLAVVDLANGSVGGSIDITPLYPGEESVAWTPDGRRLIVPVERGAFQIVEVDDLALRAGPVLDHGLDLTMPVLALHPSEPELAVSSAGTVATFDLSRVDAGELADPVVYDLRTDFSALSIASYSPDGRLFAPIPGRDDLPVIADGAVGALDVPTAAVNWIEARPLGDGRVFLSRISEDAMVVDESTGRVLAGPWSPSDGGTYFQPQLVAGGDAVVLATDFAQLHVWSLVGETRSARPWRR